jgi:hypothetical protein
MLDIPTRKRPCSPCYDDIMDSSHSTSPLPKARRRAQKANNSASIAPLQLPTLPRFHPAAYNSTASSMTTTPSSAGFSPGPLSPRSQHRISEAQRQLAQYQQQILNQYMSRDGTVSHHTGQKPPSPKLIPLAGGSGVVTPLELEGDSYLSAGNSQYFSVGAGQPNRLSVDYIYRDEMRKRESLSPRRHPVSTA